MKTAARRTPVARDRAIARLRSLTIGTGLASVVAVGGFGAIAAISYDGTTAGITTAAIVTTDVTTSTIDATISTTSGTAPIGAPTATAHAATGSS